MYNGNNSLKIGQLALLGGGPHDYGAEEGELALDRAEEARTRGLLHALPLEPSAGGVRERRGDHLLAGGVGDAGHRYNGMGAGFAYILYSDTSSNFPTLLKYSAKLMIFVQNFQDVRYEARDLFSERGGGNYYILYYNRNSKICRNCKLYFNLPQVQTQFTE
ncbi:Hypothetical_protein [Hexamita inflata]|uniref:Hypothetical_protein n=1 Tax=Hexamita inflata TaxID=28002 RepID=A0AA86RE28_9EUKA|nr:Hypothetical protein HINF_LOCUS60643 [Hexamita inflata]